MPELEGMKAICNHVKRSESTVLDWIRCMEFPAKKLGGIWISNTELISDWKNKIIANGEAEKEKPAPHIAKIPDKTTYKIKASPEKRITHA